MRNILFFMVCTIVLTFMFGCAEKEKAEPNISARFRIDSLKQDSVFFADTTYIKGKVKVYYSVINDGSVIVNCYRYTINAMNTDSVYFQIAESHFNTVPAKTERHDSTKIGIANCRVAYARIDNTSFQ